MTDSGLSDATGPRVLCAQRRGSEFDSTQGESDCSSLAGVRTPRRFREDHPTASTACYSTRGKNETVGPRAGSHRWAGGPRVG